MNEKLKTYLRYALFALPFLGVATCNHYANTYQQESIIKNPQKDDYFVFQGLISDFDQPFKVKEIRKDSIVFFVPKYEIASFKINKSESKVYELDQQGKLYDSTRVTIAKSTIDSLINNNTLSVRVSQHPNVRLEGVFGKHRENKVDAVLEKLLGDNK